MRTPSAKALYFCFAGLMVLLIGLLPESQLSAEEQPRFSIRAGVVKIETGDIEAPLELGGTPLPGASLDVDDLTHPGIFFTWKIDQNFAIETMISTPLEVDIDGGGGLLGSTFKAGELKVIPLIVMGRYNTPWQWHGIQPFVGIGATYIHFKDPKTTPQFDALAATLGALNPEIDVENQWSPVIELGLDYDIYKRLFANFTWLYFEGDTALATVFSNGVSLNSKVEYAPQFFAVTVGYRF